MSIAFTTSESKREDALRLGADEVVVTRDPGEMAAHAGSFDFILDTVAASHDLDALPALLKRDGTLVPGRSAVRSAPLAEHRQPHLPPPGDRRLADRRDRRDPGDARFLRRARHRLRHRDDPRQKIDEAYERMLRSDVKYRFVIETATMGEA
jgi:uncharacterized zinc-type alcohol dehydrogenase-like protein